MKIIYDLLAKLINSLIPIFGLILVAGGIYFTVDTISFRINAIQTEAVITRIDVDRSFDETEHTVFVAFSVDGERYEGRLGYWLVGMREGQQVKIYYNPTNPRQFRHGSNFHFFFTSFMVFFGVILLKLGLSAGYEKKTINMLRKKRYVMADIVDIVESDQIINGRPTYYVICSWTDKKKEEHIFVSDLYKEYPELGDYTQAAVYLDPKDNTKYRVDLNNLSVGKTGSKKNTASTFRRKDDIPDHLKETKMAGMGSGGVLKWKGIIFMQIFAIGFLSVVYWQLTTPEAFFPPLALVFGFFGIVLTYSNVIMLIEKLASIKNIPALLVLIDDARLYTGSSGNAHYVLQFQDEHGKIYYFRANDIHNFEKGRTYAVTAKYNNVLEVGSQLPWQIQERKVKPGYWSHFYFPVPKDDSWKSFIGAKLTKYESPFMGILTWFILLLLLTFVATLYFSDLPTVVAFIMIAPVLFGVALVVWVLLKDYMIKLKDS